MYKVEAKGCLYHTMDEAEILVNIGDMLRYDQGDIASTVIKPVEGRPWKDYTVIVHLRTYTKARWDSFLIPTRLLKKKDEVAPPARFGSMDEVAAFARSHGL